jgi:hypothetical protein
MNKMLLYHHWEHIVLDRFLLLKIQNYFLTQRKRSFPLIDRIFQTGAKNVPNTSGDRRQ